ncbi:MAG: 2Fe-2S iron-sulfur cluster binding domain-containing protein [Candidatus Binataceae bacterium]|nr:2Fe-2S iron-sulfur cluster binding domain-containing protein [Candidatus Binataceae bacterium]
MAGETFKARLEPGGREFILHPGESVLNCALRQRILLQYGCRNGRCSSCKYLLIDGEVDLGNISSYSLTESEREEGWALLCQARALSDLVIREQPVADRDDAPVITPDDRRAEVVAARPLSESLWGLQLMLESRLSFYPGQFIEVEIPGRPGSWRCYSIASSPATPDRIELIVKRIAGGEFSGRDEHFTAGFKLAIRGPYGMSYLRKSDRPVLLVATGSGLGPMLSIIRSAAERQDPRSYWLYYGARTESDLILRDELRLLEQRMAHFSFRSALSAPAAGDGWRGAVGRVTQVLQREIADASPYDAYICGQPEMCEAVATLLLAKGISEDRIFRDDFFAASD